MRNVRAKIKQKAKTVQQWKKESANVDNWQGTNKGLSCIEVKTPK